MSTLSKFNSLGQVNQFCDAVANHSFTSFSFTTKLSHAAFIFCVVRICFVFVFLLVFFFLFIFFLILFYFFPCFTENGKFFLSLIFEVPHILNFEISESNNLTAAVFFHDFVYIIKGCTLRAHIFC